MIKELSELGKTIRSQKDESQWAHDALKEETISLVLTIKPDGSFVSLQSIEKKKTMTEAVQRTSGKKARILIDNCGYVLGVYDCESTAFKKKAKEKGEQKAHDIYIKDADNKFDIFGERLQDLTGLKELQPVTLFYKSLKDIDNANRNFIKLPKKDRGGNIALLVFGEDKFVHEYDSVYRKIIDAYEGNQQELTSTEKKNCAICAGDQFPVGDFTHFPIKGVPGDKEPAGGRKLISYNGDQNPFESYGMVGNENSAICTNCAKTYVEGLNSLLSSGNEVVVKSKKGKEKNVFRYSNRKNFGKDTTMLFWTRTNNKLPEIDQLEAPDPDDVARLIKSLTSGTERDSRYLKPDQFYSCTLSGSAARISVRDWIETSLIDFRKSIAQWFQDIAIIEYNSDLEKLQTRYVPLYNLASSCQRKNNDGSFDKVDTSLARVASCYGMLP